MKNLNTDGPDFNLQRVDADEQGFSGQPTMQAYHIGERGSADVLVLRDRSIPIIGIGEVLVKVHASSLNFRDLIILNGWYPAAIPDGRVPLSDAAGEVVTVGGGVTRFGVGDKVIGAFFPNWFGGAFNSMPLQYVTDQDGWLSEYKVVNAEALVAMPQHLTYEEAATLPCAGVTAWTALAGVGPGDTVLTQGTGGVSLFALQIAKVRGASVISTTSTPEKADLLRALGADHVIDYRAVPEWGEAVRNYTDGKGVDRVVEVGGPSSLTESIKAVALGGQVSIVGILGGPDGGVDFMSLFMSHATFQPIPSGSRRDLEDLIRALAQHNIRPIIDRKFTFDEANDALSHFAKRQLFGKVVISHPL